MPAVAPTSSRHAECKAAVFYCASPLAGVVFVVDVDDDDHDLDDDDGDCHPLWPQSAWFLPLTRAAAVVSSFASMSQIDEVVASFVHTLVLVTPPYDWVAV